MVPSLSAAHFEGITGGACKNYDAWSPVLEEFFAPYRPGSVTASDVLRTFVDNNVGHWVQVIDGTPYVTSQPKGHRYAERGASVLAQVLSMMRRGWAVPDFDMLFGENDGPQFPEVLSHKVRAPVGGMCTAPSHLDIPIPHMGFYKWWELAPEMKGLTWNASIHAVFNAAAARPYGSRIKKAVFRGSCNNGVRENAALLTPTRPDILDIQCSDAKVRNSIPLLNMSNYAVVVNFPGNGYSGRTPWLLGMGSPMLYQLSGHNRAKQIQFFYPLMRPYVHYWPSMSNELIIPGVEYLLKHPDEARAIGDAAADFVRKYLLPEELDCVWLQYAHAFAGVRSGPVKRAVGAVNISAYAHHALYRLMQETTWPEHALPPLGRRRRQRRR